MNFSITTKLMQHQREAIEKLAPLKVAAFFMDMGTGKTLTVFEWLRLKQHKISKVLFFCPVSVKKTIARQLEEHTTASFYCFDNKTRQGKIPNADFYIIGIESMQSSNRVIFAALGLVDGKAAVIVDESTYIKTHNASRTKWIAECGNKAKYRAIMTGTPTTNGYQDLYAQIRFLSPKILGYGSFYTFAANHLEYSDKYKGMIRRSLDTEYLTEKMKPYVYQVTRAECLDLPGKTFSSRACLLTEQQREAYDLRKEAFFELISGMDEISSCDIFCLFNDLQQICCGFQKNGDDITELKSDRIDTMLKTIREMPAKEKVVIWAKYIYDIDCIKEALEKEYGNDCVSEYTGRKNEKERAEEARRFTQDRRFFVATQATGGHGLNELVCSGYAIFYSNTFKYGERLQAEDRQHRIGQVNKVHYIDIYVHDTIDYKISESLAKKESILKGFKKQIEEIKKQKGKEDKRLKEVLRKL